MTTPRRTICPNIICYNQIIIVSFHVDPPQYGQTYSYYSCNIPNHLIIYFYFNPTAPNLMPLLFTIRFHKWHTSLVRSHPSCHVSDSTFLAVSHLYSCLSPGRIRHNCDRCPYDVHNNRRKLHPCTCSWP